MQIKAIDPDGAERILRCDAAGRLLTAPDADGLRQASKEGRLFSFDSGEQNIDAGDTMLFVRNDDDAYNLVCDRIVVAGSNVVCKWDINVGAATTTPSGTTVTPVSINRTASLSFDHTALYDETAVADGSTILRASTLVGGKDEVTCPGLVLGLGDYIQINQETESTTGSAILIAYFEKK
jgi:YD repeat-containing protein